MSTKVILPQNEEKRVLRRNIESLLKQTYKQIQIIAVNDRSTDNSLSILSQYERMPGSTLQVIEGTDVPADWLGKLFALHQAKSHATGEWLLTIDADVIYSPHTVESALAYMEENNLDALSLLPRVKMDSFWETTIIPVMSWLSLMRVSTTQANRRSSKACFGYGNIIIFKRYAHNYIGGFSSYKNDILDDCVPMEKLKKKGFRIIVADGSELMVSRMYSSLKEIIEGFGKNTFAALRFSIVRVIGVLLMEVFFVLSPPFYFLFKKLIKNEISMSISTKLFGTAALFFFLTMVFFGIKMRANIKFYFLYILGHILAVIIICFSVLTYKMRTGTTWKGRIVNKILSGA